MFAKHSFDRQSRLFLVGLFFFCMCTLMLQIIETRILSVVAQYYLAFLCISVAMFGITVGSLVVYFNNHIFMPENLCRNLGWISLLFSVSIVLSTLSLISTVVFVNFSHVFMTAFLWLKLILILAPPYIFAGMGISLALTRSRLPIGIVYFVDLSGAALGCLGVLAVLAVLDAVSAMFLVAALATAAASCFIAGGQTEGRPAWLDAGRFPWFVRPGFLTLLFVGAAIANNAIHPRGIVLTIVKARLETLQPDVYLRWNSFSRIAAFPVDQTSPQMWGASDKRPRAQISQRALNIDGDAGTAMYRFTGDIAEMEFLKFDVTNLAYYVRNSGRAAIVGVGGGRDLLSAYAFGFRDVTGVELNPVFIDLLRDRFSSFNALASLPGVRFFVDDARSWFARSDERFDSIQMSMIDTWAATGSGAYSLSENGLYTVEGWQRFLARLTPQGIFTVSRWYAPENPQEIGRLLSLAQASLFRFGIADPRGHIYVVTNKRLATLLVSPTAFSREDLAKLDQVAVDLGYSVLVSPQRPIEENLLGRIIQTRSRAELDGLVGQADIDISPATDDRPFFFNQLKIGDPGAMLRAIAASPGVVLGNLRAFATLALIIGLSALLVAVTTLVPVLPKLRRAAPSVAGWGTLYFGLIGFGFMFVEIGLIQRLSVVLGHPVYGLAIALFGIILSTGIGSLLSERFVLRNAGGLALWSACLAGYLVLFPIVFPPIADSLEMSSIVLRGGACFLAILLPGVLMGFAFPTGMRLVEALDTGPTPWFWATNGAAGVLAAGLAVAISILQSISVTIWIGAACYLLVAVAGIALMRLATQGAGAAQVALPSRSL